MKSLLIACWACLLVGATFLSGCVSSPNGLVLNPVGPAPGGSFGTGTSGMLQVYSALDSAPDFNNSPYRSRYSDYKVYSADGTELVKAVRNDTGKLIEGPPRIDLAVGRYRVIARANGYGEVTVPVVIKPNQTTAIHLEGSHWWPKSSQIFDANPVRLPSGQIVGWPALASGNE